MTNPNGLYAVRPILARRVETNPRKVKGLRRLRRVRYRREHARDEYRGKDREAAGRRDSDRAGPVAPAAHRR